MSGEVHILLFSCGDTSEVGSYVSRSHLRDVVCGRYVASGSRVLDYGGGGGGGWGGGGGGRFVE